VLGLFDIHLAVHASWKPKMKRFVSKYRTYVCLLSAKGDKGAKVTISISTENEEKNDLPVL
jgi:hypothetical protein